MRTRENAENIVDDNEEKEIDFAARTREKTERKEGRDREENDG